MNTSANIGGKRAQCTGDLLCLAIMLVMGDSEAIGKQVLRITLGRSDRQSLELI